MDKTVIVEGNDPKNPAVSLTIGGQVERLVTVTPARVSFTGKAGDPMTRHVIIEPDPRHSFEVRAVKARSGENIRFDIDPLPARNGAPRYRLTVENTRTKKGRYYDTITLETNSPHQSEIHVHVYGNITE